MTESIKFGPEWLRNSLIKQEEIVSRPVLSELRYSREEMLGLIDERNSKKSPELIVNGYRNLHTDHFQTPMVLIPCEEERPVNSGHSRTFLNSNIKQHGFVNNNNNNWRKNIKEPEQENWRNHDYKDRISVFTKYGEKSKPNWRDKAGGDEQASSFPYSPVKDYEYRSPDREDISPTKIDMKAQNTPKRAETVEEKQNQYVMNIVSDTTTKNLFENTPKNKKNENPNIQTTSNSCELNFKKLENDILMGMQELTMDDEQTVEKSNDNKQQNSVLMSWFYVDPLGKIQGPFKEDEMSLWYQHGFFYDTLMLRRSIDSNFISLHHLIQAFGSAQPFVIASTGFPIPKVDHVENLPYKQPPPKMPIMNPPSQFEAVMYRGQSLVQQYQDPVQYQNNMQQFQPNIPPNFQYLQNRQQPPQHNIPQIDPRLINMNAVNANPYIQTQQQQQAYNQINNNPNRMPQQLPSHMMNQMPQQMKNAFQGPLINQYPQQSMIHQMPSILPTNPIQKLLFELHKQKEMEQQRAMYMQHTQNVAAQSMNEQIMQQQNKIENNRQNKIQQAYYNNSNKYDHNGNTPVMNNNPANHQNNNNNIQHNPVIEPPQDPGNFDADDEGEFRVVGNLKRKKFQKEAKEKPEKIKDNGPQLSRSATKLPDGKLTIIKNDLKPVNTDVKAVKSNNDISQLIINQLNKVEEKSNLPAMPAPWIDKVAVNRTESENLKRIQIEEEEIRQIEMQIKREKELEKIKKELDQKVNQMSWNVVVTENLEEPPSVWEAPTKSSKNVKKITQQSLPAVNNKPIDANNNGSSTKEVENDFKNWCMDMLSKMNTSIDIPVFVSFLIDLESPYEIEDYVKMYLGDTIESHLFTRKFLERRSLYRKAMKKVEVDDDLCAPPKAINPGTHSDEAFRTQNKKKLDKKTRKGMKVDANILGFKATADSNRIVGELHEDEY